MLSLSLSLSSALLYFSFRGIALTLVGWGWFVAKRGIDGERKGLCGELSIVLHFSPPHYFSGGALICNSCARLPDAIDDLCVCFPIFSATYYANLFDFD